MKKILTSCLIFNLLYLINFFQPLTCFSQETKDISISAEKINMMFVEDELNKRIFKKYVPIKVNITNKSKYPVDISNKIYLLANNGVEIKPPKAMYIYEKTAKHPMRRTVLMSFPGTIGGLAIIVFSFGILYYPGMALIVSSTMGTYNNATNSNYKLKWNISDNMFTENTLKPDNNYSAYIFAPVKMEKYINGVVVKNCIYNKVERLDLTTKVKVDAESLN